jgi:hypothetical protein
MDPTWKRKRGPGALAPGSSARTLHHCARRSTARRAAVSGICDLPLTEAGRAAVERHQAALADGNLQEWRKAYPAMVGAITEAFVRLRRQAVRAEAAPGANPSTVQGWAAAEGRPRS